MSSSENPRQTTPPSASGTIAANSRLEKAIQAASLFLKDVFKAEYDNDRIKNGLGIAWYNIHGAILRAGHSKMKARLRNESEFYAYIKTGSKERELIELLRCMSKEEEPWSKLVENEAFLKPEPERGTDPATAQATMHAWNSTFKGNLAHSLFDTISDYLSKERTPYARLATIVNSSGTGKSRMVDQLGIEVITMPMCLCQRGREGFPPVDETLCDWLAYETSDQTTVQKRLHGFAYSLLVTTRKQLETIAKEKDIPELPHFDVGIGKELYEKKPEECASMVVKRQMRLASAFREHMTKGQAYHTPNSNRETFYKQVIKLANEFVESKQPAELGRYVSNGEGVREAGKMLCRFIDEHRVLESNKGPRWPLVVLAFDEADTLTDNPPEQKYWNIFSELCQVLRQIEHLPIFSLFLSTAARFHKFSPDIGIYLDRAREPGSRPLDPISEISYDVIAYPALKDTITMNDVVKANWISHLGRPLFGTYWDNLPERCKTELTIVDYAKQKLLNGPTELRNGDWAGSLACLSTRFALEFNMDGTARDVIHAQVERHMRLCIAATTGFETMVTTSGSEPLLAEAAHELMKGSGANAVHHLAEHADLNCIDRGRRGELVAVLLIMQAYDAARVLSGRRWVSVDDFMEALLPPSKYHTLCQSAPTSWPKDHHDQKTFEAIFQDYGMWFNHVIRIEEREMMSIDHLWKFIVRGAMILCATDQQGIDIVLPVGNMTQTLGPDTVTAIIIQVKNAKDHKATLQAGLFDAMDSAIKSAIFSKIPGVDFDSDSDSGSDSDSNETPAEPRKKKSKVIAMPKKVTPELVKVDPKAVIRMVFALASPEPSVVFRNRPETKLHSDNLTASFDIWLAGLSDETFRQTAENEDLKHYRTILERSLTPHDAFELGGIPGISKRVKKLRRACRRKMGTLTFAKNAHHIHRSPKSLGEGSGGHPGVAS